jgi:DNA-binding transcriptional ArsR family regulator
MSGAARAFEMLAEPNRRRLVEELRDGERSVGDLVGAVSLSQPGVSRHLRILHHAGFVRVRAAGQRRLYSLRREPFRDLEAWLREYEDLLASRLDRLNDLVEADSAGSLSPKRKTPRGEP